MNDLTTMHNTYGLNPSFSPMKSESRGKKIYILIFVKQMQ